MVPKGHARARRWPRSRARPRSRRADWRGWPCKSVPARSPAPASRAAPGRPEASGRRSANVKRCGRIRKWIEPMHDGEHRDDHRDDRRDAVPDQVASHRRIEPGQSEGGQPDRGRPAPTVDEQWRARRRTPTTGRPMGDRSRVNVSVSKRGTTPWPGSRGRACRCHGVPGSLSSAVAAPSKIRPRTVPKTSVSRSRHQSAVTCPECAHCHFPSGTDTHAYRAEMFARKNPSSLITV